LYRHDRTIRPFQWDIFAPPLTANGVRFGRKRTVDRKKILALHESGIGATVIARQMGVGRSTVYKLLGEPSE
jgi:DNA invertase Pin-like site-specific DNA recombinase